MLALNVAGPASIPNIHMVHGDYQDHLSESHRCDTKKKTKKVVLGFSVH